MYPVIPVPLSQNPPIFWAKSVDYGPKSICEFGWNSVADGQVGSMISPIINRNLQPLGYVSRTLEAISYLSGEH
jgi:hypothetical protein